MTPMDDGELAAGLRAWAARKDNRIRAAVELLIEHGHWLRAGDFEDRCVFFDQGLPAVSFAAVQAFADDTPAGSDGQIAVLRVIADLGSGRWGIDMMDGRNRLRLVRAVTRAAGLLPDAGEAAAAYDPLPDLGVILAMLLFDFPHGVRAADAAALARLRQGLGVDWAPQGLPGEAGAAEDALRTALGLGEPR
jgi:hypothetical protein